jgi:FkbM family methyltransferase
MFYGQWSPPVDEVLFRNYFSDKKDGFFIECGAGDGIGDSCCLFFEQQGWSGINVEASDVNFQRLVANRPRAHNLHMGLGDRDHWAKFSKAVKGADAGGVFAWHPRQKRECAEAGYAFVDIDVEIITYQSLVGHKVDLFVLDVEGYELQVIKGMTGSEFLPDVICVEYPFVTLGYLQEMLCPRGYRYDFFSFNNAFFAKPEIPVRPEWFGQTKTLLEY